jgi:hypothetical protein
MVVLPAIVICVFGYRYSESRWCSGCWASMQRVEFGLALSERTRLPLSRSEVVDREPASGVARFLPSTHRHDSARRGMGAHMSGPYLLPMIACGGDFPSGFARALADDPTFGDYVAERVADGSVPLETVRALIAVPSVRRYRSDAFTPELLPLMRRGCELYAAFDHADPVTCTLWGGPLPPSVWDRR